MRRMINCNYEIKFHQILFNDSLKLYQRLVIK